MTTESTENITVLFETFDRTSVNTKLTFIPAIQWAPIYMVRIFGSLGLVMNASVILCLIKLKKTFRSKDYWFQLLILAMVDVFNGGITFLLSVMIFPIHYAACSVIIYFFIFSQINTLCAICCVCVNRFRCLRNLEQKRDEKTLCRQEVALAAVSFLCLIYCALPFLILDVRKSNAVRCKSTVLFGIQDKYYKLHASIGVLVPLAIINVLYSVCVVKLIRSRPKVSPVSTPRDRPSGTKPFHSTADPSASTSADKSTNLTFLDTTKASSDIETTACAENTTQTTGSAVQANTSQAASNKHSGTLPKAERKVVFKARREAQTNAIVLLGIILILANASTIYPFTDMLLESFKTEFAGTSGGNAFAMSFLSLNSFIDAMVYGFYSKEIRNFIKAEIGRLKAIVTSR